MSFPIGTMLVKCRVIAFLYLNNFVLNYQYFESLQAIHGYRETEWKKWSKDSSQILDKVRTKAFSPEMIQLSLVHILDLAPEGWIKPHIDSVRVMTYYFYLRELFLLYTLFFIPILLIWIEISICCLKKRLEEQN